MTEQRMILNRLLDKYENSRHLSEPGASTRRVMLKVEKKELPEYIYEDAGIRDSYNEAALELEKQHLVQLEWVKGRPVLSAVVLRLDRIMPCYAAAERVHPRVRAKQVTDAVRAGLGGAAVPWIAAWRDDVCKSADEEMKVPAFCKKDTAILRDLLCAFREYAALSGSITMRAFSSRCFSDTKYFERNVRDLFLTIARKYDTELAIACDENKLGEREQLAYLGIYARPELYELAGNCNIRTNQGCICIGAAPYGLAVPGTLVDFIAEIDLTAIRCITFIENKTNYVCAVGKAAGGVGGLSRRIPQPSKEKAGHADRPCGSRNHDDTLLGGYRRRRIPDVPPFAGADSLSDAHAYVRRICGFLSRAWPCTFRSVFIIPAN